jgi:hypothetical protein
MQGMQSGAALISVSSWSLQGVGFKLTTPVYDSMVVFATIVQTIFHPGFCFPRLSSAYVPPRPTFTASAVGKDYVMSSIAPTPPAEMINEEREKDVREHP